MAVGGAEQRHGLARALAAAGWKVVVGVRSEMNAAEPRAIDKVELLGISRGQAHKDMASVSSSNGRTGCSGGVQFTSGVLSLS
jgi:NAD(P)-dependent dehydrogenase (short-subunit alcohol dehydrogenase family)